MLTTWVEDVRPRDVCSFHDQRREDAEAVVERRQEEEALRKRREEETASLNARLFGGKAPMPGIPGDGSAGAGAAEAAEAEATPGAKRRRAPVDYEALNAKLEEEAKRAVLLSLRHF